MRYQCQLSVHDQVEIKAVMRKDNDSLKQKRNKKCRTTQIWKSL